jgi:hypothetical protein
MITLGMVELQELSGGNPGSLQVLVMLAQQFGAKSLSTLLGIGIKGTPIYILFADICNREMDTLHKLLKAVESGVISKETIVEATSRRDRSGKALIDFSKFM